MKLYIITVLALTGLLGACKKDFLELPSQTSLSTPVFFRSQNDVQQAINGAYAPLRGLYGGTNGACVMGEMRSDNTMYKYNPTDRGTIQPEFIKDFTDDANNGVSA